MVNELNKNKYLEEIINKYSDMVYRLALSRTRSKENSDDVFQEVFFRLSKKIPSFKNEEHKKAWLIKVTINCSKNIINKRANKDEVEIKDDIKFEIKEHHDIYYAVQSLPLNYRTIIYLYYYEGYKIKEISKLLKMKENTVKTNLARARQRLKLDMEGEIENE